MTQRENKSAWKEKADVIPFGPWTSALVGNIILEDD